MAERRLKEIRAEGDPKEAPPRMLTSEATFDKPREGDVRVERGYAREPGTLRALTPAHGREVEPKPVTIVYRYERRPDKHPLWGLYLHQDDVLAGGVDYAHILTTTTPNPGGENPYYGRPKEDFKFDSQGFLTVDGKRIKRFSEEMTFIPKGEEPGHDENAFEKARVRAARL